ncbi:MAG: hypothetical protein ABIH46_11090 [Chloroflexota bacterium]
MAKYKVILIDRPAWFVPRIEQKEFARIDAEVLVGCAALANRENSLL